MFLVCSCGRKQRNIFSFPEKTVLAPPNKLAFPTPRGITIKKNGSELLLSWILPNPEIPHCYVDQGKSYPVRLIGFNVYKFFRAGTIPKKPIIQIPLTSLSYKDKLSLKHPQCYYVVRAVFTVENLTFEGPTSPIAFITT